MKTHRTNTMRLWAILAMGAAGAGLVSCEKSTPAPPSASGKPSGGLSGLSETPTSLPGRSAATGRNAARQAEQKQDETVGLADELNGSAASLTVSGCAFAVPTAWEKKAPSSSMQAAAFRVAADSGNGEAVVAFYGRGIGGDTDSNIERWRNQVRNDGGQPADARVERRTVSGIKVTMVAMEGTYAGMGAGGSPEAPRANTGFRAAIIEAPQGSMFVRFTGPRDVVEANDGAWQTMILGMKKGQ